MDAPHLLLESTHCLINPTEFNGLVVQLTLELVSQTLLLTLHCLFETLQVSAMNAQGAAILGYLRLQTLNGIELHLLRGLWIMVSIGALWFQGWRL